MRPRLLALPRGTVLVLAAHPDDESLGAGAFLAAHAARGGRAVVAFATDGAAGRPARLRGPRLAALRRREARRACAVLGAACEFWGLPDGALDRDGSLGARVEEALARLEPALVLAPAEDDPHPDHRALARAARGPVLRYEAAGPARPDLLFDAGPWLGRKLAALAAHATQQRAHRWTESARRRAAALALLSPGLRYAEGFRRPARRS